MAAWEKYKGILTAATVTYVQDGQEKTVFSGMNPHIDEVLSFAGITPKFFVIGDATRDGNIQRGMWDALSKTLHL
jgi:hypothetical protein